MSPSGLLQASTRGGKRCRWHERSLRCELGQFLSRLRGRSSGPHSEELSNTIYALAVLREGTGAFLGAFCDHASSRLGEFNEQNVSNIVYSLALLDFAHEPLLGGFADGIAGSLGEFKAQGLANVLYGMGLLGFRHDGASVGRVRVCFGRLPVASPHSAKSDNPGAAILRWHDPVWWRSLPHRHR